MTPGISLLIWRRNKSVTFASPFGVTPAQRVQANVELPGVIAQTYRVAQKVMRPDVAPCRAFGGNLHRVERDFRRGQTEPSEMREPLGVISEVRLRCRRQWRIGRGRQVTRRAAAWDTAYPEALLRLSVNALQAIPMPRSPACEAGRQVMRPPAA